MYIIRLTLKDFDYPLATIDRLPANGPNILRQLLIQHSEILYDMLDCDFVAKSAHPANHNLRSIAQVTMAPPRLSLVNIGNVELDEWYGNSQ